MLIFATISIFTAGIGRSSFLQCSPSASLEEVEDLDSADYAEKQGVICEEWPFYSGGFAKHDSSSSDSSSEEAAESYSLFPSTITSDNIMYGFDDAVETHQCLESTVTGFCSKWVTTTKEYAEEERKHGGCGSRGDDDDDDEEPAILTEYQLCLCAESNVGISQNRPLSFTSEPMAGSYCLNWACLETATFPSDYDAYSLIVDNDFVITSSDSSSSEEEEDEEEDGDDEDRYNGDYYRFAKDGQVLMLDESMEFLNCWCKASSLNGEYCLNWYCESLEHDEYGCHKQGFGVGDYGWFGCYDDAEDEVTTHCPEWYGFLVDNEDRDDYRCQCVDDECISWICGTKEMEMRQNYLWYNFPLAMLIWVCLCGCCGTKMCYKKKFGDNYCFSCLKCRKLRMFIFYILFGVISLLHGGIPALLFFCIFASCCTFCAYKCENCKCCRSSCGKKWECNTTTTQTEMGRTDAATTNGTSNDGENSKEESVSGHDVTPQGKVNKNGHIRVNSVDLDDVEDDGEVMDGPQV